MKIMNFINYEFKENILTAKLVPILILIGLTGISGSIFYLSRELTSETSKENPIFNININKKIIPILLAFSSNETKAKLNINFADDELKKIFQETINGNLDILRTNEFKSSFGKYLSEIEYRIKIASFENSDQSARLISDFEGIIKGYLSFFSNISLNKEEEKEALSLIKNFLNQNLYLVSALRQKTELQIFKIDSPLLKQKALNNLIAAQNLLDELIKNLENKKFLFSEEQYNNLLINLKGASKSISMGNNKIWNGYYHEAFLAAQKALRIIYESKIYLALTDDFN